MGFFTPPELTIRERCRCGAEFYARGVLAAAVAGEWRASHLLCAVTPRPAIPKRATKPAAEESP